MKTLIACLLACLLAACSPANNESNAGNAAFTVTLTPDQQGARAAAVELLEASLKQDQEKCKALMVEAERTRKPMQGMSYGFNKDGDMLGYEIKDVVADGDTMVVNTEVKMKESDKSAVMPLVFHKEGDGWKLSMDDTFSKYIDMKKNSLKANGE